MDGSTLYTVGQIVGIVAIAGSLLIYISNNRDRIIVLKFITDIIWGINYFCTGSMTGVVIHAINGVRESIFFFRGKKKWADWNGWLVVFIMLAMISPAVDWIKAGHFFWTPVLPAVGCACTVVGLFNKKTAVTKVMALVSGALWVVYAILIGNPTALIGNVVAIVSAIIGLVNEHRQAGRACFNSGGRQSLL